MVAVLIVVLDVQGGSAPSCRTSSKAETNSFSPVGKDYNF